jgi:hypothetical protein
MSRSRRRSKVFGITTAKSEKQYKATEHRRERRAVRIALREDRKLPEPKEFGNPWNGPRDGKWYWPHATDRDMRK